MVVEEVVATLVAEVEAVLVEAVAVVAGKLISII